MKKLYLSFLLCLVTISQSLACGWSPSEDEIYYNLFMQEIIGDARYYPFLLTLESAYYFSKEEEKNENIEEWQSYLELSYEDTEYLVFGTFKAEIDSLIKKQAVTNKRLSFATASWRSKHHQALLYLSYAKYLEPYMIIVSGDGWGYGYYSDSRGSYSNNAGDLDYKKVMNVLQRSWAAEKDKELQLRYGYQMVRLAHYTRRYAEAVDLFNRYVEPLDYRPAMYYYALNQRAGAERGLGNTDTANYLFFKVFANTKNLKKNALTSIRFTSNVDYEQFLKQAKSTNEINDAYLLLGYISFSNPLAMAEKITETSPDAIQAKVLVARAINQLERYCNPVWIADGDVRSLEDKRYPICENQQKFLQQTLDFSLKMTQNKQVEEMNFWNITTAYLYFMNKNFDAAKTYLAKVSEENSKYKHQKEQFAAYIYLCEQPSITPAVEKVLFEKYQSLISFGGDDCFLTDVLANRYYLQKDYAKSFLISNSISALEDYVELDLLLHIESFVTQPDKNAWEKQIIKHVLNQCGAENSQKDLLQYISYLFGNYYLAEGDFPQALAAFAKIPISFQWQWKSFYDLSKNDYQVFTGISNKVFGYNQIECFECSPENVMKNDFLDQFPFIKKTMNRKELVEALIQLQKTGWQDNEAGAKANYLLGNFFYNVSCTGYYRHILRFDITNGYNVRKFERKNKPQDIYSDIYLKNYSRFVFYYDQTGIAYDFLARAYEQANDNELKARIAFALSKCEQANWDWSNNNNYYYGRENILISNRAYFAELAKYNNTRFYSEVKTHCKYFEYYVNHVGKISDK